MLWQRRIIVASIIASHMKKRKIPRNYGIQSKLTAKASQQAGPLGGRLPYFFEAIPSGLMWCTYALKWAPNLEL